MSIEASKHRSSDRGKSPKVSRRQNPLTLDLSHLGTSNRSPCIDHHRISWIYTLSRMSHGACLSVYLKVFKHLHKGLRALKVQKSPQSTGFGVKMPTWRPKCRWQGISVENPSLPLAILPRMGSAGALLRPIETRTAPPGILEESSS